jgi:hypothetical protein
MSTEERIRQALGKIDPVEPSQDLWSRVVHSIDEDRQHRRRVAMSAVATVVSSAILILIGGLSINNDSSGRFIERPTMEALEFAALTTLVVVLGPAIRRFGRGYANDLWPEGSVTPGALLQLLDVAYYLALSGFILISTEFQFSGHTTTSLIPEQLSDASIRIGGLLLMLGVLHALTIMALPIVALVDNSTRAHKKVPRWVLLIGVLIATQLLPVLAAVIGIGVNGA